MGLKRLLLVALGIATLGGCAAGGAPVPEAPRNGMAPSSPAPVSSRIVANLPPKWTAGDRWVYDWRSGDDNATKTVEVIDSETVNGVQYYVAGSADLQEYFTLDLHWAATVRNSKVQARMVPPHPWYVWPLEVGRRWTHRAVFEDQRGKREQIHRFSVVAAEIVDVPAGQFQALKLIRESDDGDSDQYWYTPRVGSYVQWFGRRGPMRFEERLRRYSFGAGQSGAETPPRSLR